MRTMGLDVGEKTIGIAVSDPLGITAQGLEVYRRSGGKKDLEYLQAKVNELQVTEIVVGIPLNQRGEQGAAAAKVLALCRELENYVGIPVNTWDERFTTAAAERALLEADLNRKGRKKVVDKLAAVFILQGYMDYRKKR